MGLQAQPYGIQGMLKEGHKHLSGLDEAVVKNIDACKQLSTITRTSLGPNGMNKMVINHLDRLFVTSDTATIVNELEIQHPAAKILVLAGKAQQEEIGDGANLTVSFAGELLQGAEDLIRMGLHPSEIIIGYTKAINKVVEILEGLVEGGSETMDVRNKDEVILRMKAAVASKQYGQESILCPLIADACIQVCPKNPVNFNVDNVRVAKLLGGGLHNCTTVRGMVLKGDTVGSIKKIEKAKVVVIAGGVDTTATETKGTVLIHSAEQLENYAKTEEAKVEELIKAVADSGAKVIVSGAAVGEMALHFCERYKIMVLKIASKFELRRFCRTTGCVALLKLGTVNPDDLGYVDSISVEEIGGARVTVVRNEEGGNSVTTVLLRGSTDSILDDLERAVDDGVNTYKALCRDSRIVPGAAATEIELARKLKEFSALSSDWGKKMEGRRQLDGGATVHFDSDHRSAAVRTSTGHPALQPNYSCRKVQEALEHLASIELIELCNEAKVEHCRATRDLRSCGRCVQSVLNSCGHASLCEECSQRCDACPICRYPIPKSGNRLSLRLYYECIEAGLISKRYDDRFQEKDGEKQPTADVERLYSFFDVALENNLLSLICHYITDVCMDETAVSSDPVVALLLDEVVVKDWCKRTFKHIIAELQSIYNLNVEEIKERSSALLKFTVRLSCISTVLEELESSFKGSLSAQLHDIHHLQESILKTKQHMEMMIWYTRHQSLEGLSRHDSFSSWRSDVRERKAAAVKRAWPSPLETSRQDGAMLFIEDALSNLDTQQEYTADRDGELEIASLQKDGGLSFSRVKIEGMVGSYPFENLRSAIDILFLCGSSDLVVAKQAILLYYLFDRLWNIPDEKWRFCVDDFAATFNLARHSILESFTFYLLDDQRDEALQEACHLLKEISGPTTHPKVAQVLLERQNPYAALMVLRWSGSDSGTELVSLNEAVTAVRVRVECGLLIEAFMYQRSLCTKVKKKKAKHELHGDASSGLNDDFEAGMNWLEVLVTEICFLCIRRNLVDRIIGLPWNVDEEKHLHKCLLDYASDEPLSNTGSLLVVLYLQRYRYVEAYQVDRKLQSFEQDFISKNPVDEDVVNRMASIRDWRAGLVDKSIQLLPEIEQQRVKNGQMTELPSPDTDNTALRNPDLPEVQNPALTSVLVPSYANSSLLFRTNDGNSSPVSSFQTAPSNLGGLTNFGSPSVSQVNAFTDGDRGMSMLKSISKNFKFDDITASANRPVITTPLKESNRGSSVIRKNKYLENDRNMSVDHISSPSPSPYFGNLATNVEDSPSSISGLFKSARQDGLLKASGKSARSSRLGRDFIEASGDLMDISWSNKDESVPVQTNLNGGPRWRSDDASDHEDQQSPDRLTGGVTPSRGLRRSRRTRR